MRPECERLASELQQMEQLARELHAAKQEAEDKLAQVNARLSERFRATSPGYHQAQAQQLQNDISPGFRAGGAGGAREFMLAGGTGADGYDRHARLPSAAAQRDFFQPRPVHVGGSRGVGGSLPGTPTPTCEQVLSANGQHVNKRLRPSCGLSPRGWGGGPACGPTPPRQGFVYGGGGALRSTEKAGQQPVISGLLNPSGTPTDDARQTLRPLAQQQAQFRGGAAGMRSGGGAPSAACDSPAGPGPSERLRAASHADPQSSLLGGTADTRRRYGL